MTVITETSHAGEALVAELPGFMSRKSGTVNSGQDLAAMAVVGQILTAGAATAVGSPTGNGVITVGAAIGSKTVPGTYKLVCVAAASNAGTFNFYAPDGTLVRQITVAGGATSSDHLTLTIADGATDFVAGDTYTIEVAAGDYSELDPDGTTGTQVAAGVLYAAVDATDADKACVVVDKFAVFNGDELVWPTGITTDEKALAVAQLAERNITLR